MISRGHTGNRCIRGTQHQNLQRRAAVRWAARGFSLFLTSAISSSPTQRGQVENVRAPGAKGYDSFDRCSRTFKLCRCEVGCPCLNTSVVDANHAWHYHAFTYRKANRNFWYVPSTNNDCKLCVNQKPSVQLKRVGRGHGHWPHWSWWFARLATHQSPCEC